MSIPLNNLPFWQDFIEAWKKLEEHGSVLFPNGVPIEILEGMLHAAFKVKHFYTQQAEQLAFFATLAVKPGGIGGSSLEARLSHTAWTILWKTAFAKVPDTRKIVGPVGAALGHNQPPSWVLQLFQAPAELQKIATLLAGVCNDYRWKSAQAFGEPNIYEWKSVAQTMICLAQWATWEYKIVHRPVHWQNAAEVLLMLPAIKLQLLGALHHMGLLLHLKGRTHAEGKYHIPFSDPESLKLLDHLAMKDIRGQGGSVPEPTEKLLTEALVHTSQAAELAAWIRLAIQA